MKKNTLWTLFSTFFKIGAFTFGGGYAMIPLIQREIAHKHKWITADDILDIIAIAESTPGPISVNAATFVGYKVCGFLGAFLSTFALVLPSVVVISVISLFLSHFGEYTIVKYAFMGIRAGVLALIVKALISMFKQCPKNIFSYSIMILAFVSVVVFSVNVLYVVIASGIFGLVYSLLTLKKGGDSAK